MKWRNSKERELLSSGGCREQTLPTKMNPNPDLSDVRTGKKSCEDELEAFRGESLHQTYCHSHQTHQLFNSIESNPMSPDSSSKHSDFSESEDEEITVS